MSINIIRVEAKTEGQQEYIDAIKANKIIFAEGPAGCGKTFIPCVIGISALLQKKYEKIIISRPLIQSDISSGFLPGTLEEKLEPYMRPLMDAFSDCLPKNELEKLIKEKKIEVAPVGYLRGRTFNNSFIIFDESQNLDMGQLKLALTRFGKGSKMIFTGDASQTDLAIGLSGFMTVLDKLDNIGDIGIVRLTSDDIVREPIIKTILDRLHESWCIK